MIANFPTKRTYNPGGLVSFRFVHHSRVGAYPYMVSGKVDNPVVLLAGSDWLEGYSTPYTLRFTEQGESTTHGMRYLQRIDGYVPNDHSAVIETMQNMDNQYFIALILDANRRQRLVGGYGYPLLFTSSFDSGSNRSDGKGFTFQLSGTAPFRAPEYRG